MAINKVVYGDTTLIDLTSDTVTSAAHIVQGYTGHLADGSIVTGTAETGGITVDDLATNTQPSGAITLSDDITTIGNYAFAGKPITSITAQNVTNIGVNSLQNTRITTITDENFPSLGVTAQYIMYLRMSSLVTINLTGERITLSSGSGALRDCANLVVARFPNAAKNVGKSYLGMGMAAFYGDKKLKIADLGFVRSVAQQSFYNCNAVQTIILRYTAEVAPLGNTNAFTNTPFRGYNSLTGTVYVPSALIESYKTATNWSTLYNNGTCNFVAIEGSEYELE